MKKAKVIIPALAVLTFSTIASVTGTVAWFTTQSSVTINTSNFVITGLQGDLACTPVAGVGTTAKVETDAQGNKTRTIEAITGTSLTHGSFDHKTGKVYTLKPYSDLCENHTGADLATIAGKDFATEDTDGVLSNPFLENPSNPTDKIYNAYTFSLEFQIGSGTSWDYAYDLNLYFDFRVEKSSATAGTDDPVDDISNSARGFRVAFVNASSDTTDLTNKGIAKVWSPLQGKTLGVNKSDTTSKASCYQSGTAADAQTAYVTTDKGDLLFNGEGAGLEEGAADTLDKTLGYIKDDTNATTDRTDFLGQFNAKNNGIVKLTCVAWFEGNDDKNVVNEADKKPAVSCKMSFYVKQNKPAA